MLHILTYKQPYWVLPVDLESWNFIRSKDTSKGINKRTLKRTIIIRKSYFLYHIIDMWLPTVVFFRSLDYQLLENWPWRISNRILKGKKNVWLQSYFCPSIRRTFSLVQCSVISWFWTKLKKMHEKKMVNNHRAAIPVIKDLTSSSSSLRSWYSGRVVVVM